MQIDLILLRLNQANKKMAKTIQSDAGETMPFYELVLLSDGSGYIEITDNEDTDIAVAFERYADITEKDLASL